MKKSIKIASLFLAVGGIWFASYTPTTATTATESGYDCNHGHCSFVKKNGARCGNCAQKGSYYCWSHK